MDITLAINDIPLEFFKQDANNLAAGILSSRLL